MCPAPADTNHEPPQWAGRHRMSERDGIVFLECHGPLTLDDARLMTAFFDNVRNRVGYLLLLIDFNDGGMATPETRKYLADWAGDKPGATAMLGGSKMLNTLATMLNRAIRLIHRNSMPLQSFSTEAQAIAWLRQREHELRGR